MKYEETSHHIRSKSKGEEKIHEFVLNKYDGSFLLITKGELTKTRRGKCFDKNKIPFDTYDYTIDCNGKNVEEGLVSEIEIGQLNDSNSGPQP